MIHTSTIESKGPAQVLVVMGSIRAGRRCPEIASWVIDVARSVSDLDYELLDLARWPLPMDDEPGIPQLGNYLQAHTRSWSAKIAAAAGFVFVTPQYNWGYPAPLKNAIDHLYAEWQGKPAVIVSYGGHAGAKCAAQLRQVAEAVDMCPTATMPGIRLTQAMIQGGAIDPPRDFAAAAETVRAAIGELCSALKPAA